MSEYFQDGRCFGRAVVCAWCVVAFTTATAVAEEAPADKYEQLIEALVNKNAEPKIARRNKDDSIPLYAVDHNWTEEARVCEAFNALWKNNGADLWPHLIKHLDDQRYAFVWMFGDETEVAERNTVGSVCQLLATENLTWALMRCHPWTSKLDYYAFSSPPELRDLKKWYAARSDKELYELQAELCAWSLEKVKSDQRLDDEHKTKFANCVHKKMEELASTKRPIVRNKWFCEVAEFMDAERAADFRQRAAADKNYSVQSPKKADP